MDATAGPSTSSSSSSTSQPVIFTTQTAYPLPSQKFFIPTSWRRYHLSQLVNKALSLARVVPFDFLVKGEILRTTLGEWCAEHGVGEEETLEIEYIESVLPPQKLSDFPHDDWVSSVSCQVEGHFLTGSYDGVVRFFDYSRVLTASAKLHNAPITSATTMQNSVDNSTELVLTASHDLTALLTQFTLETTLDAEEQEQTSRKATALASLHLHTSPLTSVASNKTGTRLLTASVDTLIGVWDTTVPDEHEALDIRAPALGLSGDRTKKRRKVEEEPNGQAMADAKSVKRKAPLTVMKSHTARVSRTLFGSEHRGIEGKAYSCGFDSTVRVWDVELGLCEHTITASEKPFTSLVLPSSHLALATSTDRTMMVYDVRIPTSAIPATAPSIFTHPATPSCIALPSHPGPSASSVSGAVNQVVTGAYDGIVRVWDLRSTKSAIASFNAFGNERDKDSKKILAVDWNADKGVVGVGGEAGFVVWSFKGDATSS